MPITNRQPAFDLVLRAMTDGLLTLAIDHERGWDTQPQTDKPLYLGKPACGSDLEWNFQLKASTGELFIWSATGDPSRNEKLDLDAGDFARLIAVWRRIRAEQLVAEKKKDLPLPPNPEKITRLVGFGRFDLSIDNEGRRDELINGEPVQDGSTRWKFQWNPRTHKLACWPSDTMIGRHTTFTLMGVEVHAFNLAIEARLAAQPGSRPDSGQGGCVPLG